MMNTKLIENEIYEKVCSNITLPIKRYKTINLLAVIDINSNDVFWEIKTHEKSVIKTRFGEALNVFLNEIDDVDKPQ